MAYERKAFASDRWCDLSTKKFHRMLREDPELRFVVRTPDGSYNLPGVLLEPHVPIGPIPRRVIFTIENEQLKIHGADVRIAVGPFYVPATVEIAPPEVPDPLEPRRSLPESEWHREAVRRISEHPDLVLGPAHQVSRTWTDSPISADGKRLWLALWSGKHPDVVFEHPDGSLTVVEVEPDSTAEEGFAQIWGDYVTALRVDRRLAGKVVEIRGVLALQRGAEALIDDLGALFKASSVRIIDLEA